MKLNSKDLQALCELAIDTAVTTGRYISATRPADIEHKHSSGSLASQLVTEVDHESQKRIVQALQPSMAQHDLGLLTEESPDDGSRLVKDYFWCIDPIDGTQYFIEGVPGYAVSIALVSRVGTPVIGVVYDPVTQTLYHAIRNGGAFRNSMLWQPLVGEPNGSLSIFTDRGALQAPLFEPIARAMHATWGTYGGGVLNAIWCLEHPPACYFKFIRSGDGGGCFWDFAATACIYQEVGAWASDVQGEPLNLNRAEPIYLNPYGILYATHTAVAQRFLELHAQLKA